MEESSLTSGDTIKLTFGWKSGMEDLLYCKDIYEPSLRDSAKPDGISDVLGEKMYRKNIGHIRSWIDQSVFDHVLGETS